MPKAFRYSLLAFLVLLLPAPSMMSCSGGGGGGGGGSGGGIGITPVAANPRLALVANRADGTVSVAAVNSSNGAWRHLGYSLVGSLPSGVAVNAAGTFAYVANSGSNAISGFAVAASGALTPVPGSPFATGLTPTSIVVEATGKFCYVSDFLSNTVSGYSINQGSGALSPVAGSPFSTGARPVSISADPTGSFLYVANSASDNVSMFTISPSTGALFPVTGSPTAVGIAPLGIAVDASGRFVYVSNSGSNTVSAFMIGAGGTLAAVPGPATAAGAAPAGIASDALGRFLYVANTVSNDVSGFAIGAGGSLTPLSGSPYSTSAGPDRVTADPSGNFLYVISPATNIVSKHVINQGNGVLTATTTERGRMAAAMAVSKGASAIFAAKFAYISDDVNTWGFSVNPATGGLTAIAGSPFVIARFVSCDPLGRYLFCTFNGSSTGHVRSIDPGTGALVQVDTFTAGDIAQQHVVDASSRFLYVANSTSADVSAFSIDQSNGTVTEITGSPYAADTGAFGAATDPTGRFVYVANQTANTISGYEIDPVTGALSEIAGSPFSWDGSAGGLTRQVVVDPSGRLAYVVNEGTQEVSIYGINSVTGALASLGLNDQMSFGVGSLAVDPLNRFVYMTGGGVYGFVITTPATGALTMIPQSPFAGTTQSSIPVVDPSGQFVYTGNHNAANFSAFSINPTTGIITEMLGSPYTTDFDALGVVLTQTVQ